MKILIDADATPNIKEIVSLCKKYNKEVIAICDTAHNIELDYGKVMIVDKNSQSVDVVLYNLCMNSDIVITQDYGLASICLGKKCIVINPHGFLYSIHIIDSMLEQNYEKKKLRKQGVHLKGAKKRTKKVNDMFLSIIEEQLKE